MRNAGIAGLAALILTPLTSGPATAAGVPWNLPGPVRVIFDTDMYGDIDDALALAMLHALESRGEIELLAVTISTQAGEAARYVDAIDTFYGRGSIPIGVVSGGVTRGHWQTRDTGSICPPRVASISRSTSRRPIHAAGRVARRTKMR